MNIMRVIRLATKKIPPTALLPRGGHRSLYGKKLTDMMSVFEAIDQDNSGGITVRFSSDLHCFWWLFLVTDLGLF